MLLDASGGVEQGRWPETLLMTFGFAFIYICFIHLIFFCLLSITYLFVCFDHLMCSCGGTQWG